MTVKKIAPIQPTKEQREWLDFEILRTGNSQASIIRQLMQSEIDALNELVSFAKEDVKEGRVSSSSDFKAKLARRKEAAKRARQ